MSIAEMAVKLAAVRVMHGVCGVVLGEKNAFTASLSLALNSANSAAFEHNYRMAEAEFRRLPAEVVELVVDKCHSHIASNQKSILGQIKAFTAVEPAPGQAKPVTAKKDKRPSTAVDWH